MIISVKVEDFFWVMTTQMLMTSVRMVRLVVIISRQVCYFFGQLKTTDIWFFAYIIAVVFPIVPILQLHSSFVNWYLHFYLDLVPHYRTAVVLVLILCLSVGPSLRQSLCFLCLSQNCVFPPVLHTESTSEQLTIS